MSPSPHKNVLLLIADDLGRCLRCYGDPTIQTPNIDALAHSSNGVLFTNAFASTASCSGSRSTIYTGLHTHENGQYGLNNNRHHFTTYEHVDTAPKVFNALGYLTGIVGKVHVGPDSAYPWGVREESGSRDVGWVAERAGEFFEKAKKEEKNFFLTIGFVDPHRDRTRDGFGNEEVSSSHSKIKDITYDPSDVVVPEFCSDLPEVRAELASYYTAVSRLDQGVGLVLDTLREQGLEEETLVVFVSDNGPPFVNSKTTLYEAGVHLPLIIRDPGTSTSDGGIVNPNLVSFIDILPTMIDWANGGSEPGKVNGVSNPIPNSKSPPRRGRSILPILHETNLLTSPSDWQPHIYGSHTFHEVTNYYPTRFLRTTRYKYHRNVEWRLRFPFAADLYGSLSWEGIRNSGSGKVGQRALKDLIERPPEELYDLLEDPLEVRNLAVEPVDEKYRVLLGEMRGELERWQEVTRDPWLYRDGVSVVFVQHHLDAGLHLPDRWELDVENMGSKGVKGFKSLAPSLTNGHDE